MTNVVETTSATTAATAVPPGTPLLKVEHLTMRFGGLTAVNDLSFEARKGEITALIGPNGAGKTTVFNCITGFYKPTSGTIQLTHDDGKIVRLERLNDFRISQQAKVARTFQNIRLFPGMTALENLMVAQHNVLMVASGLTFLGLIGAPSWRAAEARAIEQVPRTCFSRLNSARSFLPDPPIPVPVGSPVCAMKPSITRWNGTPL